MQMMNSRYPKWAKFFMMCQRIGFPPTPTIRFWGDSGFPRTRGPPELASRPTSGPTILRRLALKVPSADHLFVYLTIAAWWLVGPAHFDDGWMTTLLENYQTA